MKKYINIYALFILTLLGFTQCKKGDQGQAQTCIDFPILCIDCNETPEKCVESKKTRDHYYFKTGSWWVYQEVNSHQLDTQWVSQDWVNDCKFDLIIKSSLDDYERHRWSHERALSKNCGMVPKGDVTRIERSKAKAGDYVGGSYIGIFYPVIGDFIGNYGGGGYQSETYSGMLWVNNIHSEYTILNETFINVVQMKDKYNITEHSQPTFHYYAEGVGLIKKELIDSNQVWLLIDYDVQQ